MIHPGEGVTTVDSAVVTPAAAVLRTISRTVLAVTVLAGVATFWFAIRMLQLGLDDPSATAATIPFLIGMVILALAGAAVLGERPRATIGWLLLATGAAGTLSRFVLAAAVLAHESASPAAGALGWMTNWIWIPAQALALVLVLRFPDGSLPSRRWRPVELGMWTWGAVAVLVTALVPGDLGAEQLAPLQNPIGVAAAGAFLSSALSVLFTMAPVLVVVAVAAPIARWRVAPEEQRRQLVTVMIALLVLAVAAPIALAADSGAVLEGVAWLLLPAAIAHAVLRRRLWDLDLRRRLDRLRLVREEERARLQRDLHDSLGPLLGSISMRLEAARNLVARGAEPAKVEELLAKVHADTDGANVEIRRILAELGPSALADADLCTALTDLADRYPNGPQISLRLPQAPLAIEPQAEIAAFRVIGEALRNTVRHARASHCRITVETHGDELAVEVRDDGIGLDDAPAGVGRSAMADRVAALGGTLVLTETPGGGLTVRAVLPGAIA